jgi:uncharacterized Fe-S cluster protein YjdI
MNETELLEHGYRKYSGEEIDVYFNKEMCIHSTNCVKGNPDIFDTKRRPWVLPDADAADEAARVIDTCPSGALKYIYNGETEALPKNKEE